MTYSKKIDCLDKNATPLDLEQLRLLKSGDRLIVENHLPDGSKEYIRGMLRGEFAGSSLFIRNEYEQPPEGEEQSGHSYLRLGIAYMDFSGRYENDGDEKLIYLDPDLETDREYSYPIHISPPHGVSITEYLDLLTSELSVTFTDESPSILKFPAINREWIAESRSTGYVLRMDDFFASRLMRDWQSGALINDNCAYYAHSARLKCAVNPKGSCEGCKDFLPVDEEPEDTTALAPMQEPGTGKFVAQRMNELIRNLAESRAQGLEVVDLTDLQ